MTHPIESPRSHEAGFTLLETLIGTTLIVLLGLALNEVTVTGTRTWTQTSAMSVLQQDTDRALHRIVELVRPSSPLRVLPLPTAPLGGTQITFQRNEGFTAGAIQWGPDISISLEADPEDPTDGLDNNGNGLVDEGAVIVTRNPGQPNQIRTTLVSNVSFLLEGEAQNGLDDNDNDLSDERGLAFKLDGPSLSIYLTLERRARDGTLFRKTSQTSVTLRN